MLPLTSCKKSAKKCVQPGERCYLPVKSKLWPTDAPEESTVLPLVTSLLSMQPTDVPHLSPATATTASHAHGFGCFDLRPWIPRSPRSPSEAKSQDSWFKKTADSGCLQNPNSHISLAIYEDSKIYPLQKTEKKSWKCSLQTHRNHHHFPHFFPLLDISKLWVSQACRRISQSRVHSNPGECCHRDCPWSTSPGAHSRSQGPSRGQRLEDDDFP